MLTVVMATGQGSVSVSACGAAGVQALEAAQKSPGAVTGGYAWSTTPSMASPGGVAAYADVAVANAARAML